MLPSLKEILRRANRTSFYQDRFSDVQNLSIENWSQIPLTTKEDLRNAYPFGLLAVPQKKIATYHESSGTSGKPISSFFTEDDWKDVYSRFLRSRVNLNENDMVLVKTPYSLVTTALQMHGAARLTGATVIPADNRSGNMPYSRVIRLLHELPVTVTWSLPTEALIWAYLLRRQGLNPAKDFPNLRAIVVAGESLSPAKKAALSRLWGRKMIIEDYGSTETGSLAGECSSGNLHVWSDRVYFETCDDQGMLTQNEGSLVVTPLFREAMPLVRYNMEDQVRLYHDCTCGSPHQRIEVMGRRIHRTNERIYPKQIESCVYSTEGEVWFWKARMRNLELELEICGEGISPERLERELKSQLQISARVRNVPPSNFVAESWLAEEPVMQKPRYVFLENEDWNKTLAYS